MKIKKIVTTISILISLFGLAYMGYCHGKGIKDDYGLMIILAGLFLSIVGQFLGKEEGESKT